MHFIFIPALMSAEQASEYQEPELFEGVMQMLPISSIEYWPDSTGRSSEDNLRWTHWLRHRFAEMFDVYRDHNLFKGIEISLIDR